MDQTRADALRAAVEALAAEDIKDVVEQARAEARVRVKDLLADALTDALVDNVHAELARPAPEAPARAQPRRAPVREPAARPAPPLTPRPIAPATAEHVGPSGHGVYVYGVVPAGTLLPSDLPGIDPHSSPRLLTHGEVAAVVSDVPLSEFEEQRLRENLGDLRWVERTARAHEHVLETIADHATLVPMRMCAIYRTPAGVQEMLSREARPLADALRHLDGKTEWGVKVFADEASRRSGRQEDNQPPASGTDYMRQRQDARDARWQVDDELADACDAIHERLSVVSADALSAPPQRREVTGRDGQMLLNGVYLVEAVHEQLFLATVEELRANYAPLGLELVPTGPWPAYNFVPGAIGAAW